MPLSCRIACYARQRIASDGLFIAIILGVVLVAAIWYDHEIHPTHYATAALIGYLALVPASVKDSVIAYAWHLPISLIWPGVINQSRQPGRPAETGVAIMDFLSITGQFAKLVADAKAAREKDSLAAMAQVGADAAGLVQTALLMLTTPAAVAVAPAKPPAEPAE